VPCRNMVGRPGLSAILTSPFYEDVACEPSSIFDSQSSAACLATIANPSPTVGAPSFHNISLSPTPSFHMLCLCSRS
jgi:hypothetical protein